MWPASHSVLSRTSTSTMPFPRCSDTWAGSTSWTWVLIWRMYSAPLGLIRKSSKVGRDSMLQKEEGPDGVRPPLGQTLKVPMYRADALSHAAYAGPLGEHGTRGRHGVRGRRHRP